MHSVSHHFFLHGGLLLEINFSRVTSQLELNKLRSAFHASVLLLINSFVIALSKVAVDPRGDSRVDRQTTLTITNSCVCTLIDNEN